MLSVENFKSTVNYSIILSLVAFFIKAYNKTDDKSYIQWILDNDAIMTYLTTSRGYINTLAYFLRSPTT